jgi:DNA-binding HxlR family transcriptional regulator
MSDPAAARYLLITPRVGSSSPIPASFGSARPSAEPFLPAPDRPEGLMKASASMRGSSRMQIRKDIPVLARTRRTKWKPKSLTKAISHLHFWPLRDLLVRLSAKWTMPVLTALETAPKNGMRFSTLKSLLDGTSQRTLTATLKRLEAGNLLLKRPIPGKLGRHEYALTPFGQATLVALRCFLSSTVANWPKTQLSPRTYARHGKKSCRDLAVQKGVAHKAL